MICYTNESSGTEGLVVILAGVSNDGSRLTVGRAVGDRQLGAGNLLEMESVAADFDITGVGAQIQAGLVSAFLNLAVVQVVGNQLAVDGAGVSQVGSVTALLQLSGEHGDGNGNQDGPLVLTILKTVNSSYTMEF